MLLDESPQAVPLGFGVSCRQVPDPLHVPPVKQLPDGVLQTVLVVAYVGLHPTPSCV